MQFAARRLSSTQPTLSLGRDDSRGEAPDPKPNPLPCRLMPNHLSPSSSIDASGADGSGIVSRSSTDWPLLKAVAFHLLPLAEMGQQEQGVSSALPASWPLLLTKEQLSAYLAMSWSTISKICTVPPLDVGASVIRYNRLQIDEWVASLPPKAIKNAAPAAPTLPDLETEREERRNAALDKVRARTSQHHHGRRPRSSDGGRNGQG